MNDFKQHSPHAIEVLESNYAQLRACFEAQLGDAEEADACVYETFRLFFRFMEERNWEADKDYLSIYLMRIAGGVFSKKLAARRPVNHTRLPRLFLMLSYLNRLLPFKFQLKKPKSKI